MAQHEPAARGGPQRRIVIDDDAVVAADAEPLHRRAELRGRRQHVRRGVRPCRDTRRCRGSARRGCALRDSRRAPLRPRRRHVPARIDDDEVGLAEVLRRAIAVETSESMAPRIGFAAALLLGGRAMETTPSRQAQRPARLARGGGARLCAQPAAGALYLVRFAAPEFTSLCPVTGQPDFAHLVIDYAPGRDDRRIQEPQAVPRQRSATMPASTRT